MKSYEDLTKAQKEKLILYLFMRNNVLTKYSPFLIGAFMFYALGFVFLMLPFNFTFITGIGMVFIALIVFLFIILQLINTNKYIYLAFNMEDSMEDLFEIKRTDIMNLKKKWKKI